MIAISSQTKVSYEWVGKENPIQLPFRDELKECHQIDRGAYSTIHEIKNSAPKRVYKIITLNEFCSGDEIRVARLAAKLGMSPAIHDAFVIHQYTTKDVVIEMDFAGLSLQKRLDEIPDEKLSEDEVEKVFEICFGSMEKFYFAFFNCIKRLAENKISYHDSHLGNIIPTSLAKKSVQLIDFDSAKIHKTIETAARISMLSRHNLVYFDKYIKLPNLSAESLNLLNWWAKHRPLQAVKKIR